MAIVATDPFSQVPIFIKTMFGTTELGVATAFFYRRNGSLYLVSNWHTFSGRHPETGQPVADHGGVPDAVSCYLCLNNISIIQREWLEIPLITNDEPAWYHHPLSGSAIDIGVLPVTLSNKFKAIVLNDMQFVQMTLRVSYDVFVLGYPLGIMNSHGLPVWKRATVASEPGVSDPSYFVDTATRPGMSGSPVILRYRGFYKNNPQAEEILDHDWFGEGDMFAGIYSGRVGASSVEAQLGIVWKPHLIDEIIDGQTKAIYRLRSTSPPTP